MIGTVRPFTIRSKPTPERQERAGAGDLAFGKNADEFAVVEGGAGFAERLQDDSQAPVRRNRNDAERFHEGFEERLLGILRVDDKSHGAIEAGDQEKAVDKRDVVGNQECASGWRTCARR